MCGIVGAIMAKGINLAKMKSASNCLAHRGPDAEGAFVNEANTVFLGHRRLSIIDLSVGANQPMYSHDGRYVMIFNGEIYNYTSLRNKLPEHNWRTNGDSEVILELFAAFGPESFSWLNGMFAIAILDTVENRLVLARDPIGIKPLYYYPDGQNFSFASELKAIKSIYPDLKVNEESIPYFLHLGYIPAPLTIYRGVYKFPSGNFLEIKIEGRMPTLSPMSPFWSFREETGRTVVQDETVAKATLEKILYGAVERQLISDVPSGTFLSGGIDSSLVTAVASKVSSTKIKTFCIAVVDGKVNEAPYAAAVAKHLGTEHYELPIRQQDILDMVPDLLDVYDEPFGDTSAFPTMLVSKLARKHVTVALSGDGGDEQFMGYGTYLWAQRLSSPMLKAFRKPLHTASSFAPAYYKRAGKMLNYPDRGLLKSHIFSQDMFSMSELEKLLKNKQFSFKNLNKRAEASRSLTPREEQSFWDLKYYLQDDLLVKVDRASMKYSLETRVPLLDLEMIKFSLNLDEGLKVKNGNMKYLLKQVLYDLVPQSFFDRPKSGFSIPLAKLLREDLSSLVETYFVRHILEKHGFVDADVALQLKKRFYGGQTDAYFQVWLITCLHWWLEKNT